jgi:propanol-preferring alcohol dehydrogenase
MPEQAPMIPRTMKAALSERRGTPLVIREVPVPVPGPGQLLVRLESCGICHTDLHSRNGDDQLPDELYPLILGHEGIGRIVAIGEGTATRFALGDRVGLPWLYDTCLECRPCLSGAEVYCQHQHARGIHRHGAFAEYALLESRFACAIPDEINPVRGAPLLCAGLTAWSAMRRTTLRPGRTAMIVGCGGLGQYAIMIAKAHGATVVAVDRDPAKLDEARRRGADHTVEAGPEAAQEIKALGGADIAVNFAPSAKVWPLLQAAVNPMSEVVAVSLVYDPVELSTMWLIDGGHRVQGSSVGSRQELRDLLDFARSGSLAIDVEAVPLEGVDAALDRLDAGQVTGRLCVDFSL